MVIRCASSVCELNTAEKLLPALAALLLQNISRLFHLMAHRFLLFHFRPVQTIQNRTRKPPHIAQVGMYGGLAIRYKLPQLNHAISMGLIEGLRLVKSNGE